MIADRGTVRLVLQVAAAVFVLYLVVGVLYLRTHSQRAPEGDAVQTDSAQTIALRPAEPTQIAITLGQTVVASSPTASPTTAAVAAASATSIPSAAASGTSEYTVQTGDTLRSIATAHGLTVEELVAANPSLQENPDSLAVEQVITIPVPGQPTEPAAAEPTPAAPAEPASPTDTPSPWVVYVVQEGDTLGSIADHFGVSAQSIIDFNGLADPDDISPGQELTIPLE